MALASALSLPTAILPWSASAQTEAVPADYRGSAEGTVGELSGQTEDGPSVRFTLSETLGTVDSDAGILSDRPGTAADESGDFAAGSVTPLRVAGSGDALEPGRAESSAPSKPSDSSLALTLEEAGASLRVLVATTRSAADPGGEGAETYNASEISDVEVEGAAQLPGVAQHASGESFANVVATRGGLVDAFGSARLANLSLLGGLITADEIVGLSRSVVDGEQASNDTNFLLSNLALWSIPDDPQNPDDRPLLAFSAAPADDPEVPRCDDPGDSTADGSELVELALGVGGTEVSCTLPRGSNLLSPTSYEGGSVVETTAIQAALDVLTGPGGPLHGSQIVLAAGSSDEDEGAASGTIRVLHLKVAAAAGEDSSAVGTAALQTLEETVLGRASSEAAFVPAVVAEEPPAEEPPAEEPPTEEPTAEEPPVEEPPTEEPLEDEPTGTPVNAGSDDGTSDDGTSGGAGPPSSSGGGVPTDPSGAEPASADADEGGGELPFTGFDPRMLALLGAATLTGGYLLRRRLRPTATSRPGA